MPLGARLEAASRSALNSPLSRGLNGTGARFGIRRPRLVSAAGVPPLSEGNRTGGTSVFRRRQQGHAFSLYGRSGSVSDQEEWYRGRLMPFVSLQAKGFVLLSGLRFGI